MRGIATLRALGGKSRPTVNWVAVALRLSFFRSKRGPAPVDIPSRLFQNLDKLGSEVKNNGVWVDRWSEGPRLR